MQNALFEQCSFKSLWSDASRFVNYNFEISVPQNPAHFILDERGYVLDIVFHKDVRLSEVRILDIMDSDHLHVIFLHLGSC
jgi:endonuclease/exonuclease/phosphatase (EEP) superfamily protein YafD